MRATTPALGLAMASLLAMSPLAARAQTIFAGFEHQSLGTATLTVPPDFSVLAIDNLGTAGGGATWQIDAEAGSISFGDGIRGARPTSGSWNVQGTYRYGGGATGSIDAGATISDLSLGFDFGPVTTNLIHGVISEFGQPVIDSQFPPFVLLLMQQWPDEVELLIEDGEMVMTARWDLPVPVVMPDKQVVPCDEAIFRSQTGGALDGEQLGQMTWQGVSLDHVEFLGERFREEGNWYEIEGNLLLTRGLLGHELSHAVQQGPAGTHTIQPPEPCLEARQANGVAIEELVLQAEPEVGTRLDFFNYMTLPSQGVARIPTHSVEWTDHAGSDPGMTILGGFTELGAETYTVQIFHDGLLVDTETGLSGELVRAKEFVVQHNQTDLDFLRQRAAAEIDLGADVDITILSATERSVMGDRIHIIPEQLQIFPDCVEGVAMAVHRFSNVTLKRGVIGLEVAPANAFGLAHQATGDAVLSLQNGHLTAANEAWGPDATGPLSGGVRTPAAGLEGFRWQLAGNLDPQSLPPTSKRGFKRLASDGIVGPKTAGLDVEIQNGQFAIASDFAQMGSADPQVDAWLGTQNVYSGVMPAQGRVLVDTDFNEVSFTEDDDGTLVFTLSWDAPLTLLIDGQPVFANRVSERLRHKDRAVSVTDFESLVQDAPGAEIHRASIRPHGAWLSAVGAVDFGDPAADPLLLSHLDLVAQTGVEVEAEEDLQGAYHFQLEIANPGSSNVFDGDELVTLLVHEDQSGAQRGPVFAPGSVTFAPSGAQWNVLVDFAAAGYLGFRVLADGAGELFSSSSPTGMAATCDGWPVSQIVKGVGDELWVRLVFASPTTVSVPGSGPVTTQALTLAIFGAGRPPFPGGFGQLLSQGLETTALLQSQVVVGAPPAETPRASRKVALHPAVPNPFNPRTELRYELATASDMSLTIYDVAGRKVRTLVAGPRPAGPGSVIWNGRDDRGREVASGAYLVKLRTPEGEAREKVLLVR